MARCGQLEYANTCLSLDTRFADYPKNQMLKNRNKTLKSPRFAAEILVALKTGKQMWLMSKGQREGDVNGWEGIGLKQNCMVNLQNLSIPNSGKTFELDCRNFAVTV